MRKYFLFILLWLGMNAQAALPTIPDRIMKYYEIGKADGPVLYTQKSQYQKLPTGDLSTKSVVTDSRGSVVYTETMVTQGSQPISQIADVQQTKRHLELEVKEGYVHLRTRSLGPEKTEEPKEEVEKLPVPFISGASAEAFVLEHFKELMEGDTIHAKMAILEIRELIKFKFWKKEISQKNGREVMVIAMKPSSIFLSFLVDTIFLYIDTKAKKMIYYIGRTPLWKIVDGKVKALDAEIVFE